MSWTDQVGAALTGVDWSNQDNLLATAPRAVDALTRRHPDLVTALSAGGFRVERFPNFYKVVLHLDVSGASLRVHYFPRPGAGSRHSHRWPFCGKVLTGLLRHTVFEEDVVYATRAPGEERRIMVRNEIPGNAYVLWPEHVHQIEAIQPTVTLVLRGPATRDIRFVDIPGVERGWSKRYERTDVVRSGAEVTGAAAARVLTEVAGLLRGAEPGVTG